MNTTVTPADRRISHTWIPPSAARIGTTIGAAGGMNDATWATIPSGSLATMRIATKYDPMARKETGSVALDASSIRDASAPRTPNSVEYSAYPSVNQSSSWRTVGRVVGG